VLEIRRDAVRIDRKDVTVDFALSPELELYGDEIRRWGLESVRPLARQADTDHKVPEGARQALDDAPIPLGRLGRPGDALPDMPDGADLVRNVWYENVHYGDCLLTEVLNPGIGHLVVKAIGNPDQVERWYAPIEAEGKQTGFALTEPGGGSDTASLSTTATRDGDTWVINGSKIYCSLGAVADYIVVFANVDKSQGGAGVRAFIVEKGTPGFVVVKPNEDKLGLRCWTTSQLAFESCSVPVENLLGVTEADGGTSTANGLRSGLAQLNRNRPNVSGMSIGMARAALDLTSDILAGQQAGFAPHRWSLVQTEIEQMEITLNRARYLNRRALCLARQGANNRLEASIAKAFGPPSAERIIRRCMQLLGPEGASTELLLEKWYRDAKILDIFEGTGQIMRVLIGRSLMGREAAAA
jgi:acyl-CoA dehydrogenase